MYIMENHCFLLCLFVISYLMLAMIANTASTRYNSKAPIKEILRINYTRPTVTYDEYPYLHEGDIVVSKDELELLKQNITPYKNALTDPNFFWPYGQVNYIIDKKFSQQQKNLILQAMKHIQNETCLTFWDANQYPPDHGHKIYIHLGTKCVSLVGFQRNGNGSQGLSLNPNCFRDIGYPEHELLHAIGLHHEQSRPDRDNYVEVLWQNIASDKKPNYVNNYYGTSTYNQPYDYGSVMHYRNSEFGGKINLVAKQNHSICLGNRHLATQCDLEKVRHMYGCPIRKNCVPLIRYAQNGVCNDQ